VSDLPAGAAASVAGGGLGGLGGLSGLRGRVRHPRMVLPVLAPKQKAAATRQWCAPSPFALRPSRVSQIYFLTFAARHTRVRW